ncbi:DUF4143 domain-containing protein [Bdellovibrionota bacterium FG-1]
MFNRALHLPLHPSDSFFLWGPRQAGKSTLLKSTYPGVRKIDLLQADEYRRYLERPELLRQEMPQGTRLMLIDEIQKVPALLDEVHWLIENRNIQFGLCGSSARKVRKGHANLLGGRAVRFELFGLVSSELGDAFDLDRILNHGYLPRHYSSASPLRLLNSYVADYLKEEIAAEGLVRNLPSFSGFLNIAALSDTEVVNFSTIARDVGVSSPTVKGYFDILVDTLLGRWLPAYRKRPKRRMILSPKFYFSDVGVVNFLAKRNRLEPGTELYGKAFENWVFHELTAYHSYRETFADLSFWRATSGVEVDFIVNNMEIAIEVKSSSRLTSDHLKGLRELKTDHPSVRRRVVICLESKPRITEDGIEILPAKHFAERLWSNAL